MGACRGQGPVTRTAGPVAMRLAKSWERTVVRGLKRQYGRNTSPSVRTFAPLGGRYPAAIVANIAYDSDVFRAALEAGGKEFVARSQPNRRKQPLLNRTIYALRYNVERFFFDREGFRRVASRYWKLRAILQKWRTSPAQYYCRCTLHLGLPDFLCV